MKPERFFAGRTHSWGVVEDRRGRPKEIILTETRGVWDGSELQFEQDITFEKGKTQHRSWRVRKLDEHRYTATGTGIVGTAQGRSYGNVFRLDFTLDAVPGNPLGRVHMTQWMYLQSDGVTLINRDTLTKGGVIVAEITEHFRKER